MNKIELLEMDGKEILRVYSSGGAYFPIGRAFLQTEERGGECGRVTDVYVIFEEDGKGETHRWNFRNIDGVMWK